MDHNAMMWKLRKAFPSQLSDEWRNMDCKKRRSYLLRITKAVEPSMTLNDLVKIGEEFEGVRSKVQRTVSTATHFGYSEEALDVVDGILKNVDNDEIEWFVKYIKNDSDCESSSAAEEESLENFAEYHKFARNHVYDGFFDAMEFINYAC